MVRKLLLIAIGVLLSIYLLPSVNLPWSLIDDGQRIQINQKMGESLSENNFLDFVHIPVDKKDNRFRPVYWIYHYINYSILGLKSSRHHIARNILLILFIAGLYSLIKKISNSSIALLTIFLVLLFPTNLENWWRLGPQEPLLVSFAIISLWFLIVKKRLLPSLLFSFLFFFTKESSIFVVPALVLGYLLTRNNKVNKRYIQYIVLNIGLGLVTILLMFQLKHGSGYSSYFEVSQGSILDIFARYLLLLKSYGFKYMIILVSICLSHQVTVNKKLSKPVSLALLLMIFALLIQLPWPVPLGRYLLPFSVPLSFLIATTVDRLLWQKFSLIPKTVTRLALLLSLLPLVFYSTLVMISFASNYYVREKTNQKFISTLASSLKPESRLFINLTDELNAWEWYDEVQIHLNLFYQKTPKTFYAHLLENGKLQLREKDVLASWNQFQDLTDTELNSLNKGRISQIVSGHYYRPSGGLKVLVDDLLMHSRDFFSFRSPYWVIREYRWTIFLKKS